MGEMAAMGEVEGVVIACRVVSGIVGDMAATGRGDRRRRGRSGQCTRGEGSSGSTSVRRCVHSEYGRQETCGDLQAASRVGGAEI